MKRKGIIARIGVGKVYLTEGSDTENYCPIMLDGDKDYQRVIIVDTRTLELWSMSKPGDEVEFDVDDRKRLIKFSNLTIEDMIGIASVSIMKSKRI